MMQLSLDQRPHPATLPPRVFPDPKPWPDHLPVRHRPWKDQLIELDKKNPNIPRDDWDRDTNGRGYKKHLYSRIPYAQLASERLQAAVSLRNDFEFGLPKNVNGTPETPSSRAVSGPVMTPTLRRVLDSEVPMSGTSRKRAKTATPRQANLSGSFGTPGIDKESFEDGSTRNPELEGLDVDKETGRGLRDYMLNMGKKHGMRKIACDSFSFFDFTPTMRNGMPMTRLLKHLLKGDGYRTDAYEIDIPTTYTNDLNGEKYTINVTWIWFYISHDLIDIPYNGVQPPPTFPQPNPSSWVAFALPLSYANKYDTVIEYLPVPHNSIGHIPVPNHPLHPRPPSYSLINHISKRTDYDIAFSGTPIFEFSQKPPQLMSGWGHYLNERSAFKYPSSYELQYDPYGYGVEGRFLNVNYIAPLGVPGEGYNAWWDAFYRGVYEDIWAWEGVKKAMGRGCLRLVVRWTEIDNPYGLQLHRRGSEGVELGLGISGLDEHHDYGDENLDFERQRGFGNSRGSLLGKRGGTASVPPPLSLGPEWPARMSGDRLISRGQDSISDYDKSVGGTQSESNDDTYITSQEEKDIMQFHFGIDQNDGAVDFGRENAQRQSIFDSWPRHLNENGFSGFRGVGEDGNDENRDPYSIQQPYNSNTSTQNSNTTTRNDSGFNENQFPGFRNVEGEYGNDENRDPYSIQQPHNSNIPTQNDSWPRGFNENQFSRFRNAREEENNENNNALSNHPPHTSSLHTQNEAWSRSFNSNKFPGFRGVEEEYENNENHNPHSNQPHGFNTPQLDPAFIRFGNKVSKNPGQPRNNPIEEGDQNDENNNTLAPQHSPALAKFFKEISQNSEDSINDLITTSPAHPNIYPYKTSSLYNSPRTPRPDPKLLHFAHIMEAPNGPISYVGSPWLEANPEPGAPEEEVLVFAADEAGADQADGEERLADRCGTPFRLAIPNRKENGEVRFTNEQLQELERKGYRYKVFKSSPSIEKPHFEEEEEEEEEDSDEDENPDIGIQRRMGRVVYGVEDDSQFTGSSCTSQDTVLLGQNGRGYATGRWGVATSGSSVPSIATVRTVVFDEGDATWSDATQSVATETTVETENTVIDPRLWHIPTGSDADSEFDVMTEAEKMSENEENEPPGGESAEGPRWVSGRLSRGFGSLP